MDRVLSQLRAAAEPTRLRLLALCARGAFCVSDLCEVLGQSQPRLSRHLKLLVEAGLLERVPEGANAYFGLPPDAGQLIHDQVMGLITAPARLSRPRSWPARTRAMAEGRLRIGSRTRGCTPCGTPRPA